MLCLMLFVDRYVVTLRFLLQGRQPPRSTHTVTRFPYTTLCRTRWSARSACLREPACWRARWRRSGRRRCSREEGSRPGELRQRDRIGGQRYLAPVDHPRAVVEGLGLGCRGDEAGLVEHGDPDAAVAGAEHRPFLGLGGQIG